VRRLEAVDPRERRIGVEVVAVGRSAEDSLNRVVEQAVVAALRLAQREIRFFALRDVLDDALEPRHVAGRIVEPDPAFPDPTYAALGVLDPVLELEAAARSERFVDHGAYTGAILGVRELLIRQSVVE
jgi:hypothetical protein